MHSIGCRGPWSKEAIDAFLTLSKIVATQLCQPVNEVISTMSSSLSLTLMRQNARAIWLDVSHQPHLVNT